VRWFGAGEVPVVTVADNVDNGDDGCAGDDSGDVAYSGDAGGRLGVVCVETEVVVVAMGAFWVLIGSVWLAWLVVVYKTAARELIWVPVVVDELLESVTVCV
jgi:hypothetical protein